MKTILLPSGVAESWYHITAGGETYESRVCRGSDIHEHLAELCFGEKSAEHDVLDHYATELADPDRWCWCGKKAIRASLACGEDPDIVITLIDDRAAIARLNAEEACDAQWYPVKDILPLDGERVLMAWVRGPGKEHTMRTGFHREHLGWRGSGNVKFKTEPTHWRALPVLKVLNTELTGAKRPVV